MEKRSRLNSLKTSERSKFDNVEQLIAQVKNDSLTAKVFWVIFLDENLLFKSIMIKFIVSMNPCSVDSRAPAVYWAIGDFKR